MDIINPVDEVAVNRQTLVTDEAEIRNFLQDFAKAIRAGRLQEIMGFYDAEMTAFDMMPPLQFTEKKEYENIWEAYFTNHFQFPVEFDYHEQQIFADGQFAFTHSLIRMAGKSKTHENTECWMRNTTCLKKVKSQWRIIHEHNSVPLDAITGKGLMNLKPNEELQ